MAPLTRLRAVINTLLSLSGSPHRVFTGSAIKDAGTPPESRDDIIPFFGGKYSRDIL